MSTKSSLAFFMERLACVILTAFLAGVLLTGCQGATLTAKQQTIPSSKLITLGKGGEQSGQYQTDDLSIDYRYVRTGDNLQLSGVVNFSNTIQGNFIILNAFELVLALTDGQGQVLQKKHLAASGGGNTSDPIQFSSTVMLSPGTAAMSFAYSGTASAEGMTPTNFWDNTAGL